MTTGLGTLLPSIASIGIVKLCLRPPACPRAPSILLILRVLRPGPLHGYAIAQRIRALSSDQLSVEEGSLYPALQKALANGWLKAEWTTSDTGRQVRSYRITAKGLKQLETEQDDYQRMADAIAAILEST